jgi:hypothetical protein
MRTRGALDARGAAARSTKPLIENERVKSRLPDNADRKRANHGTIHPLTGFTDSCVTLTT